MKLFTSFPSSLKCAGKVFGRYSSNLSLFLCVAFQDAPEAWQVGFQDPATPVMQGIIDLHHDICFFLLVVLVFVMWMLSRTLFHFQETKSPVPEKIYMALLLKLLGR